MYNLFREIYSNFASLRKFFRVSLNLLLLMFSRYLNILRNKPIHSDFPDHVLQNDIQHV